MTKKRMMMNMTTITGAATKMKNTTMVKMKTRVAYFLMLCGDVKFSLWIKLDEDVLCLTVGCACFLLLECSGN